MHKESLIILLVVSIFLIMGELCCCYLANTRVMNQISWLTNQWTPSTNQSIVMVLARLNEENVNTNDFPYVSTVHYLSADHLHDNDDCKDESTYYLRFMVDNYDQIEPQAIYVFGHAHRTAWHYHREFTRQLAYLVERSYFVEQEYGGIFCYMNTEFPPHEFILKHYGIQRLVQEEEALWRRVFYNTSLEDSFTSVVLHPDYAYPCCGTFFVRGSAILRRRKSEYAQIIENEYNVARTETWTHDKRVCGRVLEGSWHVLLNQGVHIPKPPLC